MQVSSSERAKACVCMIKWPPSSSNLLPNASKGIELVNGKGCVTGRADTSDCAEPTTRRACDLRVDYERGTSACIRPMENAGISRHTMPVGSNGLR